MLSVETARPWLIAGMLTDVSPATVDSVSKLIEADVRLPVCPGWVSRDPERPGAVEILPDQLRQQILGPERAVGEWRRGRRDRDRGRVVECRVAVGVVRVVGRPEIGGQPDRSRAVGSDQQQLQVA